MKTIVFLLAVIAPFSFFAQQGIVWGDELTVADGSMYGNIRPRLAIDANGDPIVLFGKSGAGDLFVSKRVGGTFSTPVQVNPVGLDTYLANWTGPDIAASGNTVVVVFKAQPISTGNIYAVRSTDGGLTFSDTIRVDDYDAGQTWMPALDMDDNGNPHVTYMTFAPAGGDERIAVSHSTDGGLTYLPMQTVTSSVPGIACDCCPPEFVTNGNYQLALFRNNETNIRDIWGSLSEDGGSTFPSVANIDQLGWSINSCPSTGPHGVISGDSAYVVFASRASGDYRVYVSASGVSGGLSMNSVTMMTPPTSLSSDQQNYPRISGDNDTLVMIWEEREMVNTDVLAAVTTTGDVNALTSYKARVNVNTDGFQGKPDVVFKNGVVHAIYQDIQSGNVIYRSGTIADVTGMEELSSLNVSVYPNPTKGAFTVTENENKLTNCSLYTPQGNRVNLIETAEGFQIPNADSGIYFVQMELENGTVVTKRLVVL